MDGWSSQYRDRSNRFNLNFCSSAGTTELSSGCDNHGCRDREMTISVKCQLYASCDHGNSSCYLKQKKCYSIKILGDYLWPHCHQEVQSAQIRKAIPTFCAYRYYQKLHLLYFIRLILTDFDELATWLYDLHLPTHDLLENLAKPQYIAYP